MPPDSFKIDLAIAVLPPVGILAPLPGPALVCAAAKRAGFSAKQFDLNLELYQQVKHQQDLVDWMNGDPFERKRYHEVLLMLDKAFERWVAQLAPSRPRWVGLSVLTRKVGVVMHRFLPVLRRSLPDTKIVIGGAGLQMEAMAKRLRDKGAIDAYIIGEGEQAIVDLLSGNMSGPGINGNPPSPIEILDGLPIPDYSDLPLEQYGFKKWRRQEQVKARRSVFYIEGSRGCVRKCSFCDIPQTKPGYRFRSAECIMREIDQLDSLYGIDEIQFVDSLMNGSLPHMRKLCDALIARRAQGKAAVPWSGYFIVRPKRSITSEDFDRLAKSGAKHLHLGIESGSEQVRKSMNKLISNEDLDFTLNECFRTNIGAVALLMVGYPTETTKDFQLTLEFLEKYRDVFAMPRSQIRCSWRVGIAGHASALNLHNEKYNIQFDATGEWHSPHVNLLISAKRYFQFCAHVQNLGLRLWDRVSPKHILAIVSRYGITPTDLMLPEEELLQKYQDNLPHAGNRRDIRTKVNRLGVVVPRT